MSQFLCSLSNSRALQEGVGKAALDLWGSDHKTFAKLVNVIPAAPGLNKSAWMWQSFLWYSQHFHFFFFYFFFPGKIILLPVWRFNLFHIQFIPFDIPAQGYSIRWQPCPGNSCGAESRQIAWGKKKWKEIISILPECFFQAKIWRKALYPVQTGIPALTGDAELGSERILWEIWVIPALDVFFQTAMELQNILAAHL